MSTQGYLEFAIEMSPTGLCVQGSVLCAVLLETLETFKRLPYVVET